jgi:hypothetical protein
VCRRIERRRLLVGAAALLAGCGTAPETDVGTGVPDTGGTTPTDGATDATPGTGGSPGTTGGSPGTTGGSPGTTGGSPAATTGTDVDGGTPSPTPTSTPGGELDLREANVTGVDVSASGGEYAFDVTLYHDDVHESEALVQPIRSAPRF